MERLNVLMDIAWVWSPWERRGHHLFYSSEIQGILGFVKVGQDGDVGLDNLALFKLSHLFLGTKPFVPAGLSMFYSSGFFSSLHPPQSQQLFILHLRGPCLYKTPGKPHSVLAAPPGAPELFHFS